MSPELLRLAGAAGIEDGYWDGLGVRRDLSEPTAVALLTELGLDQSLDPNVHLEMLMDSRFLSPLPHTELVPAGRASSVLVALPDELREQVIPWALELESGEQLGGEFVAAQAQVEEERTCNGRHFSRFRISLQVELAPGYHRFKLPNLAADTLLIVPPSRCFIPTHLLQGGRRWGIAVQLYALRSARNWGMGDFQDLATIATAAGAAGAAFIGLNPLHARHLARPDEASPYAPSSRFFLDPVYIAVESVAEFADCEAVQAVVAGANFQQQLALARKARLVDYAEVTALKLRALSVLFEEFQRRSGAAHELRQCAFREFVRLGGAALSRYADFEARSLDDNAPSQRHEFLLYLQWLAAQQFDAAARAAQAAGMSIGLYCDLAVGAAQTSAEAEGDPDLFARGVFVGAPPDMLNRQGQNWGLCPWNPLALEHRGFAPFRALLEANMRNAGALRIDHVMALTRLFWIPLGMTGADGGYVRNPFETLAAIVALESERNHCMVIGEDLGAVPDGLRARLRERGFLSYRVLVYERHWQTNGRFCLPREYPAQALATVATHDMPTMTEFWPGEDITRRDELGLYPTPQQRDEDASRRVAERDGMLRLLGEAGLSPAEPTDSAQVIAALHEAIASTPAMLAVVQLDDLIGEKDPVNIPGTYREYANWRRKLSLPLEDILSDARWHHLAAVMRRNDRNDRSSPA